MRHLMTGVAATLAFLGVSVGAAKAEPAPRLIFGVDRAGDGASVDRIQFLFGGRNYCWYDGGWRGPGFYWCGYAYRQGLGWGGGEGFHGWRGGHGGGDSRASGGRVAMGGRDAHGGGGHAPAAHVARGGGHAPEAHAAGARAGGHEPAGHGGGERKPG